jgi:DNA-binding beta-propeller fold protein YncE
VENFIESLAINSYNNLVYVSSFLNNTIYVINSTDNSIVKTIEVGGDLHIGESARNLYYDTMNNLLYVNIGNTITIIDGTSNKIIANNIIIGTSSAKIVGEYNSQIYNINSNIYYLSILENSISNSHQTYKMD